MENKDVLVIPNFIDLSGKQIGRLLVVRRVEDHVARSGKHRVQYLCECGCGKLITVIGDNLRRGNTLSCGCLQKDTARRANKTHGETNSRLYGVWCGIKRRCNTPSDRAYRWYGARGITMCDEWHTSYQVFRDWAYHSGYDPDAPRGQCTIDRIDPNGNYEPSNCRWVSQLEQANNLRSNHRLVYNGETHTMAEWGRIMNIPATKICERVTVLGWPIERALLTP